MLMAAWFLSSEYIFSIIDTIFYGLSINFFGPLKYSLLPIHLKKNELIAGNGLVEGGTFIAILLGTIIGGLLITKDNGLLIISTIIIAFAIASLFW